MAHHVTLNVTSTNRAGVAEPHLTSLNWAGVVEPRLNWSIILTLLLSNYKYLSPIDWFQVAHPVVFVFCQLLQVQTANLMLCLEATSPNSSDYQSSLFVVFVVFILVHNAAHRLPRAIYSISCYYAVCLFPVLAHCECDLWSEQSYMSFEVRFSMLSVHCVNRCSSLCTHFACASLMVLSMPTRSALTLLSPVLRMYIYTVHEWDWWHPLSVDISSNC